jgi:hypothetical protein
MIEWWCELLPYGPDDRWTITVINARMEYNGKRRWMQWNIPNWHVEQIGVMPDKLLWIARWMRRDLFDEAGVW